MAYKVFISHSTHDQELVASLTNLFIKFGIEIFVAEWDLTPGSSLDKNVFEQIESADCMVVLLTQHGIRSNWVQQEIGYALKINKLLTPIVEKGTDYRELVALQGRVHIEYDPLQAEQAIVKAADYVKSLKLKKNERNKSRLVLGGMLTILLLIWLTLSLSIF